MKKIILLSACSFIAAASFAQIPNSGFENWATTGNYTNPDSWTTLNAMTAAMSTFTAEKGTPGTPPGSSFLKLTSKTVTGIGVMPGIAATGQINMSNMTVTGGFPYTTRPASLTGSWQYMAMSGSDQGVIAVYLTKWNSSSTKRDTVAYAVNPLTGMAMSWANFTIPLTYNKSFAPDSALIIMSSSGLSPANGSYLWVDNLAFTGSPAAVQQLEETLSNLTCYPNPAQNSVMLSFTTKQAGDYHVQFVDVAGRIINTGTVKAQPGENRFPLNIHALTPGIYTIVLGDGTQQISRKLIVQ